MEKHDNNISLKIKKLTEMDNNNKDNKDNKDGLNESDNFKMKEIINDNSDNIDNINNINKNENIDNLDINSEKSKNSYKSMFSIISKYFDNDNDNDNDNENNNDINNSNISVINKNIDINRNNSIQSYISQVSINSTSSNNSNNTISFWEALKLKLNNIKNKIIFNYNIFSSPYNLNYTSSELAKEIQIFDEKYTQHEKLLNRLKYIPWFSYRKNFDQIRGNDKIYTTDAGWGCMIRATQMILAQGLCKIYSIDKLNDFINQYLAYFYDNRIPIKFMCKNKNNNFENIKNLNNNKLFEDFEVIDKEKEFEISFINVTSEVINGLENMSERKSNRDYLTPPFSLRGLLNVERHTNKNGKKVGEWVSNYDTIRLINIINKEMNKKNDCDFKIINFKDGIIYIEDIINECFEEYIYKDKDIEEFELLSVSSFENEVKINNDIGINRYEFNGKKYKFKNKFILFVSVRHGLYLLDEEMFEDVLKIFDIETNIGFIGGKNTRAFYFIGKCGNNVIFLDPHFVQDTIPLNKFGTDSVQETYIPNDIFYMQINELSPSFTIGFAVKDMQSFKKLMKTLTSNYFINQKEKDEKPKEMSKNLVFIVKNCRYPFKNLEK